ncbi:MAG: AMP-binding protein, partial [Candidatus Binatia bacterium]
MSKHDLQLPAEQPAIEDKRLHSAATFLDFPRQEIAQSIPGRLESIVRQHGERIALIAANHDSLTHAGLYEQVTHTVKRLNDLGIGRGDRVAFVMSNGLPMAVAFLAIAAGVTCAPINPALRQQEFELIFSDLGPKALVVESGTDTAALAAAQRASIPIIELSAAARSGIGQLSLHGEIFAPTAQLGFARSDDVALMLFTSGTTARPKLVPLTHANLLASAHNIAATLELSPDDRCLNVMPLFHIHGLIGGLLASLVSGGSVVCPPGFNAPQFFDWLKEFQPTWYSAVPTMHQLILSRAQANVEILRKHPLRFIRSSSAALPSRVMENLEKIFAAPVIESYGMTEATHQMASNPLPPRFRKPGSVGKAAGPEVAIMDELGNFQSAGTIGEIVIRGANVMAGYRNSGNANAKAFTQGWFRTGDQGYLDNDGYLFVTGRIKELINRGGEKISPREIDDVLLAHPAVAQAVAFAVSHATLGEDVVVA